MARETAEQNYFERSRLWFPEDVAPFGELNLVRIDHGHARDSEPVSRTIDSTLTVMGPSILRQAWVGSQWLQEVSGEENIQSGEDRDFWGGVEEAVASSITKAAIWPGKYNAWFAVRPPRYRLEKGEAAIKGLGSYILLNEVVGMANAKHDVSGSAFRRAWKRIKHPEKVYAAVSNINVLPKEQNKNIGAALLYASLGMFKPEQRPTMYVAAANQALIQKLGELGYRQTGSQNREDLLPGLKIEEVRLQGKSVDAVRSGLLDQYEWLDEAIPAYPTWRP